MKLVSFTLDGSEAQIGAVEGNEVLVLTDAGWGGSNSVAQILKAGELDALLAQAATATKRVSLDDITFLPSVFDPPRIFCAGVNYEAHRAETGRDPTKRPTIFTRTPQSQVGHKEKLVRPPESERIDFEGEIAIVIGKGGRRIPEESALDHVALYSAYNDVSIRDWQLHTSQWIPGKNFDGLGSFGPYLVTPDDMPPQSEMRLTTRLNGEIMQDATADMMIFSMAELINYISGFTELLPGDVIVTGTPGGVGAKRTPPIFMKPGDVCEIEVTGVGVLSNPITE